MKKVLVVDDNQNNKLTLELLLEEFDVEIFTAENGLEAVEVARQNKIDLIYMDLMMPVMDGIEATKTIREFDKRVIIVAITALDDDASKESMLRYGAEDYIRKPIDPDIFTRRTKNYLEIIDLRGCANRNLDAINLFDENVFFRTCSLNIVNQKALAEFWEFYLTDSSKRVKGISDCVRIIYALGSYLLESGYTGYKIVSEESEVNLYITLTGISILPPIVIKNILVKNYPFGVYKLDGEKLSFSLKKDRQNKDNRKYLNDDEKEVLSGPKGEKITAKEFVESTPFDLMTKIDALEEEEDKLDFAISDFANKPTVANLLLLADRILVYNSVIDNLFEFQHLAFAINSLATLLKRVESESLDEDNVKKMISLLSGVLSDLASWRKSIFIDQIANDIHYLDASLLSSCLQIEMIFEKKEIGNDHEIEFF